MKKEMISVQKEEEKEIYHNLKKVLVNIITGLRTIGAIAIVPIFTTGGGIAAGVAATCFFITDFIDGQLARRLKVQSFFGSLLDSISDKLFGIICLSLLATQNPIFIAIIASEIAIVAANYIAAQNNKNVQSSKIGKAKTLLLGATITGSFFCTCAPTLREILKFTNVAALDKLLSINPNILTTLLAIPAVAASTYVLSDYVKKATSKEEPTIEKNNDIELLEQEIKDIQNKKEELEKEKKKIKELKSRKEIIHDLFDTEFYLEHKDDSVKKLLYK